MVLQAICPGIGTDSCKWNPVSGNEAGVSVSMGGRLVFNCLNNRCIRTALISAARMPANLIFHSFYEAISLSNGFLQRRDQAIDIVVDANNFLS